MMNRIFSTCAFTETGKQLEEKLSGPENGFLVIKKQQTQSLEEWVQWCFERHLPLVFIGACGIAVRSVAPYVQNKLTDSPVIVLDEKGSFAISVLSGHAGGGNALARLIAEKTGAVPVITTATDVEGKFSVDVFAVNNGLKIVNKEGIRLVSEKVLAGKKISVWIEEGISFPEKGIPEEIELISGKNCRKADVCISTAEEKTGIPESLLYLQTKNLCLGTGCKKGKTFEELKDFAGSILTQEQLQNLCCLASIDLKKDEAGLNILASYLKVPFLTFQAEQLLEAGKGTVSFSESDFVEKITGVSNVCERSAVCAGGNEGRLIIKKTSLNGMTLALFQKKPSITTWSSK